MGGYNQPQAHVQVVLNMVEFGMEPQTALDVPRFCILDGKPTSMIAFEEGIEENEILKLKEMGHTAILKPYSGNERLTFGNGQIIIRNSSNGVLWAGSDPRIDGCAIGF
jgi:gamma-glutamyltranspeptidase / glutathione hydrolase